MTTQIIGQWVNADEDTDSRAKAMLANRQGSVAVWVGRKRTAEPKITVYGRDGRKEQISHTPVDTFTDRLAELTADWPAEGDATSTHSGGDDTDAAAKFILEAGS